MYLRFQKLLDARVRAVLREKYQLELPNIVIEQPPKIGLGEYALPLAFELAKRLRKPPRKVAEELLGALEGVPGFKSFEIAGAGYINARLDRGEFAAAAIYFERLFQRSDPNKLAPLTLFKAAMAFALGGLAFWFPAYLMFRNQPNSATAVFGDITALAGLISTLAGGFLADRLRTRRRAAGPACGGLGELEQMGAFDGIEA